MHLKRQLRAIVQKTKMLSKKKIAVVLFFTLLLGYALVFFVSTPVTFSYSKPTCAPYFAFLPDYQKSSKQSVYEVRPMGKIKIGSVAVLSLGVCFSPKEAPVAGKAQASWSPWGGPLFRKTFSISVPKPYVADTRVLSKPISASRPLAVPLSGTDRIFSYFVKVGDKAGACYVLDEKSLSCDTEPLGLDQGAAYKLAIERFFNGKRIATAASQDITTISATKVTESSVGSGETIFTKAKSFGLVFDKEVKKVHAALYRLDGDKKTPLPSSVVLKDKTMQLFVTDELPRSTGFILSVDGVEAADGSSLEQPYELPFSTSGGPRVTSVNVGTVGVPMGATVVVSFDQPLSETQDISHFVNLGGGATLVGKQGNQLLVRLAGVPLCGDFSIKLTNDLQSNYDIAGNSAWSFGGRTICHTVGTIGYSVRGRPITAYFFGSGNQTVLFTGAIHGNELSTKSLMNQWIQDLEANARAIPANKSIVVVPQINPDGVAAGSRTNAHNIDVNRNFATSDWQSDVTDVNNNPFPGGGGASPMSEPETLAIASLARRLHPLVILSYHSIGGVLAANQAGGSNQYANTYATISGYRNTTGQTSDTFEYAVTGTADDWYAQQLGVASILIELSSSTYSQFDRNQKAMWAMVNL